MIPGNANALLMAADAGGYQVSRSLRFNASDSAYLSRTPASAGNRKTWTYSFWVKKAGPSNSDGNNYLSSATSPGSTNPMFVLRDPNNAFDILNNNSGGTTNFRLTTTAVYRDYSSWMHVLLAIDTTQATASNRAKLYVNGTQVTAFSTATYPSQNTDLDCNGAIVHNIGREAARSNFYTNAYLADIHFIDGQALDPTSFGEFDDNGIWQPKAYTGSYGTNGFHLEFADNSAATATTLGKDTSGNGNNWAPVNLAANSSPGYDNVTGVGTNPNNMFDLDVNSYAEGGVDASLTWNGSITLGTGKFYVICAAWGISTQGPSSVSLVINGTTYTTNWTTLRSNTDFHDQQIGVAGTFTTTGNGRRTTLTPSVTNAELTSISCGATGGGFRNRIYAVVFIPSGVSDTSFADHVVVQNISAPSIIDSLVDVPTNGTQTDTGVGGEVVGNYATLNPLKTVSYALSNGNLDFSQPASGSGTVGTVAIPFSGKWYWEITPTHSTGEYFYGIIGEPSVSSNLTTASQPSNFVMAGYAGGDGKIYKNSYTAIQTGLPYRATGYVWGIAVDVDANTIQFYVNGATYGSAVSTSLTSGVVYLPWISSGNNSGATHTGSVNFGQRPFAYTAPSGFKALCTANLPAPVVTKPSTVMDVALYTGNASARSITGIGFSPDFVWIKGRSGATDHALYDIVRGAEKDLVSNSTAAETTQSTGLTAFNSDGFSIGTLAKLNTNSATYAGWCWDAGSSTVTNTQGSITSTVRANASAGFSIVTYTGVGVNNTTIGHGLGVAPRLIIIKSRSAAEFWIVLTTVINGSQDYGFLNSTATFADDIVSSTPTSTVFSVSNGPAVNGNTSTYVAYCFAPVSGYSSISSWTGNGSTDGPFVFTGMRPRWIMYKVTNVTGGSWILIDTARDPYNVSQQYMYANSSQAEASYGVFDILSNGFKIRTGDSQTNGSGNTYIYAAFAESPFNYSRAR